MRRIFSIQYLRGLAALAVVYHHAFENRHGIELQHYAFGVWGVDIFFVISGFIMWVTTAGSEIDTVEFWRRRAVRIYPLYWVALSLWIVSRFIVPDRLANSDISAESLIFSFLLIPHYHLAYSDHIWPILVPGWTLQYELFFYLIFGLCIHIGSLRVRAGSIIACLFCLSLLGLLFRPTAAVLVVCSDPQLIEFAGGVVLGIAYLNNVRLVRAACIPLIVGTIVVLTLDERFFPDGERVLVLGIPAFLLVFAAVSLEQQLARSPSEKFALLGDASYSLYLFHPLAIAVVAILWARFSFILPSSPVVFIFVAVSASVAASLLVHWFLEKPLVRLFSNKNSFRSRPGIGMTDAGLVSDESPKRGTTDLPVIR